LKKKINHIYTTKINIKKKFQKISIVKNIPKLNNLKKICLSGNKIKSFNDIDDLNILHLFGNILY